jgi:hypothetical protein
MKDYCTCGRRRIDETFLSCGLVYCGQCKEPLCCDGSLLDPSLQPHAAEVTDGETAFCWAHRTAVEVLTGRSRIVH